MFRQISFLFPSAFGLLLLLLPLIWWHLRKRVNVKDAILLPTLSGLKGQQNWRTKLLPWLPLLSALAFVCFVIALARPQRKLKPQANTTEGIDIMLVLDISSSMLNPDFPPNRLVAMKRVANEFIENRLNDRIGLVSFSGEAFTVCPLTQDHEVLESLLNSLECGILEQGTAIGMGLATGVSRLKEAKAKSKVLVLLTDGGNNAGYIDPIEAANLAKEFDIKVYTIGIGSVDVQQFGMTQSQDFDEDVLKKIAETTKGQYFHAGGVSHLREIYGTIDRLEKSTIDSSSFKRMSEEFYHFVGIGLMFLLVELMLRWTVFKRIP
jgi:Ca-activated chloride channel family protein